MNRDILVVGGSMPDLTKPFVKLFEPLAAIKGKTEQKLAPIKNKAEKKLKDAAPANRNFDITAVTLHRFTVEENGTKVKGPLVGSFVPELYEMALAGKLQRQWEEAQWANARMPEANQPGSNLKNTTEYMALLKAEKPALFEQLYRRNSAAQAARRNADLAQKYVRKTPFELAVVPGDKKALITHYYKAEFKFARDHGFAFPAFISKLRVEADYLKDLDKAGLMVGTAKGFKVNFESKEATITLRESVLHYTMQWAAMLLTLTAGIGLVEPLHIFAAPTPANLATFALIMGGTWLARKYGNDFGWYDVAEGVNRDVSWLFSADSRKGKFSITNTLKTVVLLGAVGYLGYLMVPGMYASTLALPIWEGMTALGANAKYVELASMGAAGFLSAVTALQVWTITFTQRFFWGMSFWDNQIAFTPDMGSPEALPAITLKTRMNELKKLELHLAEKSEHPEQAKQAIEESHKNILNALDGVRASTRRAAPKAGAKSSTTLSRRSKSEGNTAEEISAGGEVEEIRKSSRAKKAPQWLRY